LSQPGSIGQVSAVAVVESDVSVVTAAVSLFAAVTVSAACVVSRMPLTIIAKTTIDKSARALVFVFKAIHLPLIACSPLDGCVLSDFSELYPILFPIYPYSRLGMP
jgi:hypothetical protein